MSERRKRNAQIKYCDRRLYLADSLWNGIQLYKHIVYTFVKHINRAFLQSWRKFAVAYCTKMKRVAVYWVILSDDALYVKVTHLMHIDVGTYCILQDRVEYIRIKIGFEFFYVIIIYYIIYMLGWYRIQDGFCIALFSL